MAYFEYVRMTRYGEMPVVSTENMNIIVQEMPAHNRAAEQIRETTITGLDGAVVFEDDAFGTYDTQMVLNCNGVCEPSDLYAMFRGSGWLYNSESKHWRFVRFTGQHTATRIRFGNNKCFDSVAFKMTCDPFEYLQPIFTYGELTGAYLRDGHTLDDVMYSNASGIGTQHPVYDDEINIVLPDDAIVTRPLILMHPRTYNSATNGGYVTIDTHLPNGSAARFGINVFEMGSAQVGIALGVDCDSRQTYFTVWSPVVGKYDKNVCLPTYERGYKIALESIFDGGSDEWVMLSGGTTTIYQNDGLPFIVDVFPRVRWF